MSVKYLPYSFIFFKSTTTVYIAKILNRGNIAISPILIRTPSRAAPIPIAVSAVSMVILLITITDDNK